MSSVKTCAPNNLKLPNVYHASPLPLEDAEQAHLLQGVINRLVHGVIALCCDQMDSDFQMAL